MRNSTFETIGTSVVGMKSSTEVLDLAGLNYNVIKRPLFYTNDGETFQEYSDKVYTVNEQNNKILGVVSPRYEICQNREAFSFIDYIGNSCDGFEYVKAGETVSGLVYIIAKLPEVTILGDLVTPYIIFQNSHNGLGSIKATISPLRIVCQNQFNLSFKESSNTVRIIHSTQMESKILTARNMLSDVSEYMSRFNSTAEQLSTKHISQSDVIKVFNDVFKYDPNKMSIRQMRNFDSNRIDFMQRYLCPDNQNFVGTVWGVINGAADYLTHHKPTKSTNVETAFVNTTILSTVLNQFYQRMSV